MLFRAILIFLILLLISGCAELPSADYDGLRAIDPPDAQSHLHFLRQQGEAIAGTPFVDGNKVTLLHDGASTYPAMR
jgi:hypothetical protein